MTKQLSLIASALCSTVALVCCFIDAAWSVALFALATIAHPTALIALGASRRGSLGPLGLYLAALVLWLGAVLALLLAPPDFLAGRTLLGAPWSAVAMLVGLWLVPMAWTTYAYVRTFDHFGLTERDLKRIRRVSGREA